MKLDTKLLRRNFMAQSRFSRRNDDEHTEEKKKGGALGSLAAKAKEKLDSAAGNIKGVFSKEKQASRTAEADAPFEVHSEPVRLPLLRNPFCNNPWKVLLCRKRPHFEGDLRRIPLTPIFLMIFRKNRLLLKLSLLHRSRDSPHVRKLSGRAADCIFPSACPTAVLKPRSKLSRKKKSAPLIRAESLG